MMALVQLCENQTRAGRFCPLYPTMFSKIFTAVAVLAVGCYGFVACNNDASVPAPQSASFSQAARFAHDETDAPDDIIDDADEFGGAARLAAIDTANQVKVQIKVTGACSSTGSASFKYAEGNSTGSPLSTSAVSSKNGWKGFSVAPAKFNTVLKKTFDKTKQYVIYAKSSDTMNGKTVTVYKYVTTLDSNPPAEKALNKAGTKRTGRPITTNVVTLGCPN